MQAIFPQHPDINAHARDAVPRFVNNAPLKNKGLIALQAIKQLRNAKYEDYRGYP